MAKSMALRSQMKYGKASVREKKTPVKITKAKSMGMMLSKGCK